MPPKRLKPKILRVMKWWLKHKIPPENPSPNSGYSENRRHLSVTSTHQSRPPVESKPVESSSKLAMFKATNNEPHPQFDVDEIFLRSYDRNQQGLPQNERRYESELRQPDVDFFRNESFFCKNWPHTEMTQNIGRSGERQIM